MDKAFSKNIIIGVLIVVVIFFGFVWFKTPKITDLSVGIPIVIDTGEMINLNGAWLPPIIGSEKRSPLKVLLTNTSIDCYRSQNLCKESRAIIDNFWDNLGMHAFTLEYPIQEWGDEFIVAAVDLPVRTDELRINRRKESAILIQTEKNTDSAASQPFVWELVGTNEAMKRFRELYK